MKKMGVFIYPSEDKGEIIIYDLKSYLDTTKYYYNIKKRLVLKNVLYSYFTDKKIKYLIVKYFNECLIKEHSIRDYKVIDYSIYNIEIINNSAKLYCKLKMKYIPSRNKRKYRDFNLIDI